MARVFVTVSFDASPNQVDSLRGMGYTNVTTILANELYSFIDGSQTGLRVEEVKLPKEEYGSVKSAV